MKNKILICLFLVAISACAKKLQDNPLLIPPNFATMPSKDDADDSSSSKKSDSTTAAKAENPADIKEIKDLLLR